MNTELFISSRIFFDKKNRKSTTRIIVNIAVTSISLGLVVMILTLAIVRGFKREVSEKVAGFGSHIIITNHDTNSSYEMQPIDKKQDFYPSLKDVEGIKNIQIFATKAGIVKTKKEIQGVVLKGISSDFDWSFFKKYLIAGNTFAPATTQKPSNKILISKYFSEKIRKKTGDTITTYFIQQLNKPTRARRFEIAGIYETSMEDIDHFFAICDIAHIQKLNDWTKDNQQIGGFEILIDDFERLDEMSDLVYDKVGYQFDNEGNKLNVTNIKERSPEIFGWLQMSDLNVNIILVIMIIVAGINMASGLLILIIERTNMIGILKALGARNFMIQKIFMFNAAMLIGKGLLWGNIIGILICILQSHFGIISLDPASYYMDTVPIELKFIDILWLNALTMSSILVILTLPSLLISSVKPLPTR